MTTVIAKSKARCPYCGYTKHDAQIHMDHHLCKEGRGKEPWNRNSHLKKDMGVMTTVTALTDLETLVESWVKNNPEVLAATAERARKTSEAVLKEAVSTDEQLNQRVTI